ncbi:hypothetical protein C8R42DRAFT_648662 [Lentinula raphanica]|nr:hypothetical protein C8R42DRAFT_648662 [Lentinula raphanica]
MTQLPVSCDPNSNPITSFCIKAEGPRRQAGYSGLPSMAEGYGTPGRSAEIKDPRFSALFPNVCLICPYTQVRVVRGHCEIGGAFTTLWRDFELAKLGFESIKLLNLLAMFGATESHCLVQNIHVQVAPALVAPMNVLVSNTANDTAVLAVRVRTDLDANTFEVDGMDREKSRNNKTYIRPVSHGFVTR